MRVGRGPKPKKPVQVVDVLLYRFWIPFMVRSYHIKELCTAPGPSLLVCRDLNRVQEFLVRHQPDKGKAGPTPRRLTERTELF